MSILKKIISTIDNIIETHQRSQVMRALMEMSNAQLDDIGVSRYQLERGIKAYPWREEVAQSKKSARSAQVLRFQRSTTTSSAPAMDSTANDSDTQQAA